jgi:hypothetical protein
MALIFGHGPKRQKHAVLYMLSLSAADLGRICLARIKIHVFFPLTPESMRQN